MADTTVSRSATLGLDLDLGEADSPAIDLTLSPPDVPVVSPVSPVRRGQSLVVFTDAVSLATAFAIGALARQPFGSREGPMPIVSLARELPYIVLYIVSLAAYGLYRRDGRRLRPNSFLDIGPRGHALALGAILTLAVSAVAHRLTGVPKIGWAEVLFMTAPALVLVPMGRGLVSLALRGNDGQRSRVVIVGSGLVATSLAKRMERFPDIKLLGFVDDDPHTPPGERLSTCLGPISNLPSVCEQMQVERVLVAFSKSPPTSVTEVLRRLPAGVHISVVPRLFELVTWQSQMEELHGLTVMDIAPPQLGFLNRTAKRCLDIVVSVAHADRPSSRHGCDRGGGQADFARPGLLPPGPGRLQGDHVQDDQVPDYAGRGGCREAGPARPQRRGRRPFQAPQRPQGDFYRAVPAQNQPRRTSSAHKCAYGEDVAGRAAPVRA